MQKLLNKINMVIAGMSELATVVEVNAEFVRLQVVSLARLESAQIKAEQLEEETGLAISVFV